MVTETLTKANNLGVESLKRTLAAIFKGPVSNFASRLLIRQILIFKLIKIRLTNLETGCSLLIG